MKETILVTLVILLTGCSLAPKTPNYVPTWDTNLSCPQVNVTPPEVNVNVEIPENICGDKSPVVVKPPVSKVEYIPCDIRMIARIRRQHTKVVNYIAKPDITPEEVLKYGLAWINTSSSLIGKLEVEYTKCLKR